MGYFKVLAGVAAGVAAVACLPIAGSIGAVTLAGAALAGAAGGAAAKRSLSKDVKKKARGDEGGQQASCVRATVQTKGMISELRKAEKRLKDERDYFNLLIAMTAVGVAAANADGKISEAEIVEIDGFCGNVRTSSLPPHIKGRITHIRNNPPTLEGISCHISKVDKRSWPLFEHVIMLVTAADGKVNQRERKMLELWRTLYND